ncbi:MAG TPA: preprotein translocase subunit SecG [Ruminococcaceae bacterium]|jgi:preprotein translocase subunit SecG|nr:preprotein translocase subunit SecG [Oscillospiraceae bacterium]
MSAVEIVIGIILIIFSIFITAIVLMQEGHEQNVGVITGGADTFLSKNQARSVDAFLARWTKVVAVGFFVLVIAINIFMYFKK